MQLNLKMFGPALFIVSIPFLIALPQSFLASDVGLRQDAPGDRQATGDERRMPLFGKITAVRDGSLQIQNPNGETGVVKLTPQTEFPKDQQAAKVRDFKVRALIAG